MTAKRSTNIVPSLQYLPLHPISWAKNVMIGFISLVSLKKKIILKSLNKNILMFNNFCRNMRKPAQTPRKHI